MSNSNRWFGSRNRNSSPDSVDNPDQFSEEGSYYDGIGAELAAERIRCGLTLHEISQLLRIRQSHLEAIEAGRFGDLPGRIYALGFVRSYAEYLGADGDVCITLFKAEVGPTGHSRKLIFPAPPTERRRPGAAALAASVLLAAAIYGGWYALQGDEAAVAELVPEVPARFVAQAEQARSREVSVVSGVSSANAAEQPDLTPDIEERVEAPADLQTVDLAVVGRTGPEPAEEDEPEQVRESEPTEETSVADADPQTAPEATEAAGAREPVAEPAETGQPAAEQLALVAPPPVPEAEPQPFQEPRMYGITNRNSRTLVRATGTVQIIVKSADGAILMPHRVLQAGDIYRAPNLPGVYLEADRTGELQLIVDGRLIGRGSRVAGNSSRVSLDPARLKALGN